MTKAIINGVVWGEEHLIKTSGVTKMKKPVRVLIDTTHDKVTVEMPADGFRSNMITDVFTVKEWVQLHESKKLDRAIARARKKGHFVSYVRGSK